MIFYTVHEVVHSFSCHHMTATEFCSVSCIQCVCVCVCEQATVFYYSIHVIITWSCMIMVDPVHLIVLC